MTHNILYLHGFASSPGSTKAGLLRTFLQDYADVHYAVPDLNAPDFEHLTLTAQLERIAATVRDLPKGPVYLVGSSFGGLATLHFLDRYDEAARVEKAVLLAPALHFLRRQRAAHGEAAFAQWREDGYTTAYHYAHNKQMRLHYGLVEDVAQYDDDALDVTIPLLIYHGEHDESVDPQASVRFAAERDNVTLHILDSDHALTDKVDVIHAGLVDFFGLHKGA
jgi:uncharacterized protein